VLLENIEHGLNVLN